MGRVGRPGTPLRPIVLYREMYVKPGLRIKAHCLPTLPSATAGFVVDEAYVLGAGRVKIAGLEREYQDVRIYLKEG